jgi:Flp pilus assembly protein TadG
MISPRCCRKSSDRRGVAAVEFALVAPLFVALLLGIIEFGRMLMVQEILVNAAREGARAAIQPGETDAQVTTVISNYMSAAGIPGYTSTLSPTLSTNPAVGAAMTMTVSVPCSTVSYLSYSTWFQGQSLSSSVVMMRQ